MKMSHQYDKSLSNKHKLLKNSNDNHCCSIKSSSAAHNSKPVCCNSIKTDVYCNFSHKVKRLKSRKERNQIRGQERHMSQHSRRDVGEKTQCHRIHPMSSSIKGKKIAKPFITQKPSIITERRLTSIKGLFSHEIRSVDIERLVSEQMKRDNKKKQQSKQSMTHNASPLPPSVPDSDQDCISNDVQEPENKMPPQVKRKRSRKECTGKNTSGFQTNKQVTAPKGSSRVDGKLDRKANNSRKEDTNSNTEQNSQCSLREAEHVVLSLSENEPVHQSCSTPDKNNSDILQTYILESNNKEKRNQRFEKTSTVVEFPDMECSLMSENQQTLNFLSEPDYGLDQLAGNVTQGKQMSGCCRAAVKRLATRLCQASDLKVSSRRCPLLTECREALMQMQKRHSFQLKHNLHRLHSVLNGKQTASQLSSGHTHKDCSCIGVENEDRCYSRNLEIWTDDGMHLDYLPEEVKQNLKRGASTKKCKIQEWKASSPPIFLKEPLHSNTHTFDSSRAANLSQDCFSQPHLNQDQPFTHHPAPILRVPAWSHHPVNPCSQQHSQRRDESLKNAHSDLSGISQLWREDPDNNLNSYLIDSRREKTQEASIGGSSFWSRQQQIHEEKQYWAPFSFSASYLSEGFQYEPFFRCPRPSNTQHRSDCFSFSLCPRSSTPFYPPLYQL